uniref:Uncharacterized protein n=1 Tax=Micrurus spixii TaxID=129469 RepID=A0A2D4L536_9SAUR
MSTKNDECQTTPMTYHMTFCFSRKDFSLYPFSYVSDIPSMTVFLSALFSHPSFPFAATFPAWLTSYLSSVTLHLFLSQCIEYQTNDEYRVIFMSKCIEYQIQ